MASAPQQQAIVPPPIGVGERNIAALALLVAAAIVYATLGAIRLVPLPASLALAQRSASEGGHLRLVVSGYFSAAPSASTRSTGGYEFATSASGEGAQALAVLASPADLTGDRVVAVIDTASGNGSPSSPLTIQRISGYGRFIAAVIVGVLIALWFAYWLAGTVVALVRRRG